ncbi:hypothetical protein [Mucilaginibacter sp.]|jgi:hypothetical protein|uniref:hypothetical protein n=1 Tax=Mucilaginibacter sp. TaxID=1882438 RepID=UPI002CDB4542|nr:hypothetical protein [Mucilaginibacter sp.]HTI57863.1 hypothetical protein [Mucilaginibacter sp.]
MNHLFTFKARIILFALLLSYIGSKAQTTSDTVKSSNPAMNIDTSLAAKSSSSQLIKTDTTLVIRAGATIMKKADTTMVIDPDGSLAKKFNEMVAAKEKADLEKNQSGGNPVKVDSSSVQKSDAPIIAKQDNTAVKTDNPAANAIAVAPAPTSETTIQVHGTTPPPNTYQQVRSATNPLETHPAGTDDQQAAAQQQQADNVKSSVQQQQATTDNAQPATQQQATADNAQSSTQQQASAPVDTSKKADSAMVAKVDTTIKQDTTIKKSDSTMMSKSDTSMMVSDTSAAQHVKAVNAYLEVGGPGLAISGNYDARFKKERNGWGYRIGAGYFASGGNTVFTVPFQINYLYGEHSALLELGAGTTFLNSTGTNVGNSKWEFDKVTGFIATATIGFRYQPQSRGLNFRIAFVPILYDEGLIAAGGVSVGYTFK